MRKGASKKPVVSCCYWRYLLEIFFFFFYKHLKVFNLVWIGGPSSDSCKTQVASKIYIVLVCHVEHKLYMIPKKDLVK